MTGRNEIPALQRAREVIASRSVDIRTAIVVVAFSMMMAGTTSMAVIDPYNDFAMYYDVSKDVDRTPIAYPEGYSVWLYTPPAKSFFKVIFSPFRHYQDVHRF